MYLRPSEVLALKILAAVVLVGATAFLAIWYGIRPLLRRKDDEGELTPQATTVPLAQLKASLPQDTRVGERPDQPEGLREEELAGSAQAFNDKLDRLLALVSRMNRVLEANSSQESQRGSDRLYPEQITKFQREQVKLEETVRQLRRDNEHLDGKQKELTQTIQRLQENNDQLQQEAKEFRREQQQLEVIRRKQQEENDRLRQEAKELQHEQRRLELIGQQLEEDNGRLHTELDAAGREMETEKQRMTESLRKYLHARLLVGTPPDNGKITELVDHAVQAMIPLTEDSTAAHLADGPPTSRQDAPADQDGKLGLCWDLTASLLELRRAVAGMSTAETVKYVHHLSEPIVKYVGGGGSANLSELQQWADATEAFLGRCRPDEAEWAKLSVYVPPLGPNSEILQTHARWKETTMRGFMRELLRWKATAYDAQEGELHSELAVVMP